MSRSPVSENEKKIEAQMLSVGVGGDEADADADVVADVITTGVDVDVVNVVTGVDVCNGADGCDEVVKDGNGGASALVLTLTV